MRWHGFPAWLALATLWCGSCQPRAPKDSHVATRPPRSARDWLAPTHPLVAAASLDVPHDFGEAWGEISLLPFEFDPEPVEAWRYDACVEEAICPKREFPQPASDGPNAPAVGMRWEHANRFCEGRQMRAQSPEQDYAIRDGGARPLGRERLNLDLSPTHVVAGFRCTRLTERSHNRRTK